MNDRMLGRRVSRIGKRMQLIHLLTVSNPLVAKLAVHLRDFVAQILKRVSVLMGDRPAPKANQHTNARAENYEFAHRDHGYAFRGFLPSSTTIERYGWAGRKFPEAIILPMIPRTVGLLMTANDVENLTESCFTARIEHPDDLAVSYAFVSTDEDWASVALPPKDLQSFG